MRSGGEATTAKIDVLTPTSWPFCSWVGNLLPDNKFFQSVSVSQAVFYIYCGIKIDQATQGAKTTSILVCVTVYSRLI